MINKWVLSFCLCILLSSTTRAETLTGKVVIKGTPIAVAKAKINVDDITVVANKKGRVISAVVVFSSKEGFGFEENAIKAVRKLRFEPFIKAGEPVRVKVIYPIDFVLVA